MSELRQGAYTRTEGREAARTYPRFFIDTVLDQMATEREGREIYKEEERVEIIMPGLSQLTKPVFKVTREYTDRWPDEYKAFKAGSEIALNGTPIEQWPILRRAQVLEMRAMGFRTVEDIAGMPDTAMQRIGMGGMRLRQLAQAYLDDEQAGAALARSTAENLRQERIVAEQNEKITNLSALCERLSSQLIALQNQPSPIATHIPGMHDPIEALRQSHPQEPAAQSSLADLPEPRRRGRPSNAELAARATAGGGDAA